MKVVIEMLTERQYLRKEIVKSKRYSGEHWQYDETIKYSREQ